MFPFFLEGCRNPLLVLPVRASCSVLVCWRAAPSALAVAQAKTAKWPPRQHSVTALALAARRPFQLPFWTQAEGAAKRSGAPSRPGNEVFALLGRTGTGQCPVAVTGTSLSHCPRFWRRPRPAPGAASNLAGTGLGGPGRHLDRRLASKPSVAGWKSERPCLFASGRSLRLRAPSPSAAGPSAGEAPGPPKHHVAPRGELRCRCSASRLRSGTPTVSGRLPADPGGGREVGHFSWLALGRFRPSR